MKNSHNTNFIISITNLFKSTFIILKQHVRLFVLFYIVSGIVLGIICFVSFALLFGAGFNDVFSLFLKGPISGEELPVINPWVLSVSIATFIIGTFIAGAFVQIGTIVIATLKEKVRITHIILQSLRLLLPFVITNILAGFIVFGGFMFFILPGFFFAFLFMFAQYEVVINKKIGISALLRSSQIVIQNARYIIARLIILIGFSFFVQFLLSLLSEIFYTQAVLIAFLSFGFTMGISVFAICYSVLLYKHSESLTEKSEMHNISWVWIIVLLGWSIFFVLGSMVLTTAKTYIAHVYAMDEIQQRKVRQIQFEHYNQEPQLQQPFEIDSLDPSFSIQEITY